MYWLYERPNNIRYYSSLIPRLKENNRSRIFKSHSLPNGRRFYGRCKYLSELCEDLFQNALIINVYRDGKDALMSQYYHERMDKKMTFSEYLRLENNYYPQSYDGVLSKAEYWAHCVSEWMKIKSQRIIHIRYEDIILNYEDTLSRIGKFLDCSVPAKINDIRLIKGSSVIPFRKNTSTIASKKAIYTTVNFRAGRIGDYASLFTPSDLAYFESIVNKFNLDSIYDS